MIASLMTLSEPLTLINMKKQNVKRGKNLELDPQLHTELRIAAAKSGCSMKSIVTQLVREFLKGFHAKN